MTEATRARIIAESFEDPEEDFAIPRSKLVSRKSRTATFLFCFFLGGFGAHRFYVGKPGTAVLMMFTFGGLGIWTIIDFIVIIAGGFRDGRDRRIVNW